MFGFLKDKLKKAADSLKKVFAKREETEERPTEIIEPISKEEAAEARGVAKEIKKEVREEIKELKKDVIEEKRKVEKIKEELKREEKELEKIEAAKESVNKTESQSPSELAFKIAEENVFSEVEQEIKKEIKEHKESLVEETEKLIEEETKLNEEQKELEKIRQIEESKSTEKIEIPKPKKKHFFEKIFGKKEKETVSVPTSVEKQERKKGIFTALFEKKLGEAEFEKFFNEFEISLLESNVAFEVIQLLKKRLKEELVEKQIPRGKTEEILLNTIKSTLSDILIGEKPEKILKQITENKKKGEPTKILFLGVNGVGKTTTLARIGYWLKQNGFSVVFAASDTFRAASIEQLEKHAEKLGVNVIKHKYGGDPAAVAFDAIEHAKSKGIDVVLIDSAGRQHTNVNLMEELKKLKRVSKPDFTIFVADALTGNDAIEQAKEFGEKIGFDFSVLAKTDVDQKGGAIISVSYVSGKPILFLGVGQEYKDLEIFDKEKIIRKIIP